MSELSDSPAADRDDAAAPTPTPDEAPAVVRRTVRGLRSQTSWRTWAARPRPRADVAPETGPLADLLGELRVATTTYTRALRTAGVSPERMLPQVKALVREAMTFERWVDPAAADALTAYVVAWSIDAYYGG